MGRDMWFFIISLVAVFALIVLVGWGMFELEEYTHGVSDISVGSEIGESFSTM